MAVCSASGKERVIQFDILRVVALGYIIGVRHLDDSANDFFASPVDTVLTYVSLGLFIFLSGLLLSRNYPRMSCWQDFWTFLRKRFLRIYPLYVLALSVQLLFQFMDFTAYISHVFLINMVTGKSVRTLWFVSLICSYYLLFPLLVFRYRFVKLALLSLSVFFVLASLWRYMHLLDYRLIFFFPAFVLGILFDKHRRLLDLSVEKGWMCLCLSTACLTAWMYTRLQGVPYQDTPISMTKTLLKMLFMLLYVPPMLFLADKMAPSIRGKARNLLLRISYASYGMYLFHRLVFHFLVKMFHPQSDVATLVYLAAVGLPITYFIGYKVQEGADRIISRGRQAA